MKRLLLAPLFLIIFLAVESARANGRKPFYAGKGGKGKQQEYITRCNSVGLNCNNILEHNFKKITNKAFIKQKKSEARNSLNRCINDLDGSHCRLLIGYKSGELSWIEDEITEKEFNLMEKLAQKEKEYFKNKKLIEDRKKRIEERKNSAGILTAQQVVDKYEWTMRRDCETAIKSQLKDPRSYKAENVKFVSHLSNEHPNGVVDVRISFDAKNSFGGNAPSFGRCVFDSNGKMVQFPTVVSRF